MNFNRLLLNRLCKYTCCKIGGRFVKNHVSEQWNDRWSVRTWSVEKVGGACAREGMFERENHHFFKKIMLCCLAMGYMGFFYVEAKLF